jgi:hypothetical protein
MDVGHVDAHECIDLNKKRPDTVKTALLHTILLVPKGSSLPGVLSAYAVVSGVSLTN